MKIRHFNLQGVRRKLVEKESQMRFQPNRRQFIKTLGLGAIAINPSVEVIKSIVNEPFTIETNENSFKVIRHGKVAWEISPSFFAPGSKLTFTQKNREWLISLQEATYQGTLVVFDFLGRIYKNAGTWLLEMKVSPFGIETTTDFPEFLDHIKPLQSEFPFEAEFCRLGKGGSVDLNGNFLWQMDADWQMRLVNTDGIVLHYCGKSFPAGNLVMEPYNGNNLRFLHQVCQTGTLLSFPDSPLLNHISSLLEYNNKPHFSIPDSRAGMKIFLGETSKNRTVHVLWGEDKGINNRMNGYTGETIELGGFFFSSLFSDHRSPDFYVSAKIKDTGVWINNSLGSFRLISQNENPDFEAFGTGTEINEALFEPRMDTFLPHVSDAYCMAVPFKDPPGLFFEDQRPVKQTTIQAQKRITVPVKVSAPAQNTNTQREPEPQDRVKRPAATVPARTTGTETQEPVRQPVKNASRIEIGYDDIRFRPNKSLSVKILRPEDLLWLEFEFQNFNFSNKGQAPFLELANPKEQGIIIIHFPTQHTLEQAFFETTPMDPAGNEPIVLPAKQMRARKSRLVYELEAGHPGFELTMSSLLDWSKFKLRVHPRAWIKLPQVIKAEPVTFLGSKVTTPVRQRVAASGPSTGEYSLKILQKSVNKSLRPSVYHEDQLNTVLAPEKLVTLQPAFDISKLKIDMKVGPVPDLSTSIEAPALLYISPNQVNDFSHRIEVKFENVEEARTTDPTFSTQFRILDQLSSNKGEITELWHTSLGVKLQNAGISQSLLPKLKTIRALWAFDADKDVKGCAAIDQPFQASLDANDRHKLVHTTSNYELKGFTPIPVPVKKLMLTSLGAYLDWHAFFDVPSPTDTWLNVIEWEHLATLGRDHYVKIVREGYLFPFGHRAALVKVTERKFNPEKRAAVNMMRMYIVVLQKEVLYERNDPAGSFIRFPFQEVRIENDKTPNIDKPDNIPLSGKSLIPIVLPGRKADPCRKPGRSSTYNFYINVGQKGFPFDLTVTDKEGVEHAIRMPLAFVENVVGRTQSMVNTMVSDYNGKTAYNTTGFSGQDVAYADCLVDGDTSFETDFMKFGAMYYPAPGEADLKFHPVMQEAGIFIKQVNELTGKKNPTTITLEDDDNEGNIFAKVSNQSLVDFSGGSDKAGGFLTPNMAISGLSKLQGPIGGDIEQMKNLNFVASDFFKSVPSLPSAKIFGVIDIFELVGVPDLTGSFNDMIAAIKKVKSEIEKLKNEILLKENEAKQTGTELKDEINQLKAQIADQVAKLMDALNSQTPKVPNFKTWFTEEAFYAEYKWKPDLEGEKKGIEGVIDVKVDNPTEALQITTTLVRPFDAQKASSLTGDAKFSNFSIELLRKLGINFKYVQFKTGTNGKTDVKVDMASPPIAFIGELSFVNNLQSIIPSTGFSEDGPYVNITTSGIAAGFNISVPNITVGVCNISNISLGACVNLPFTSDPLTINFNFCTRQNPFLLTVMIYGGGGYFMLTTSLKEIVSVEAAFEFGAAVALDIGVASGSVSIMGGFYFKYEFTTKTVTLTGYIRINGRLSILGIITVSLEFYLALTYVKGPKVSKLEGEATLKVKIEIFCFSKSVSCTVRRTLAGADSDPTFAQMMELDDWQNYCLAFSEN